MQCALKTYKNLRKIRIVENVYQNVKQMYDKAFQNQNPV